MLCQLKNQHPRACILTATAQQLLVSARLQRAIDDTVLKGVLTKRIARRKGIAWIYQKLSARSYPPEPQKPINSLDRADHQAGSISDMQQSPVERWDSSYLQG
jgi:hypothetical protein